MPFPKNVIVKDGIFPRTGQAICKSGKFSRTIFIVTDRRVNGLYGKALRNSLEGSGFRPSTFSLPVGESVKNLAVAGDIYRWLARNGADRHSPLIALGGGTVCDLAGFVAATYMRGIPLVNIPTTFLAQVDAGIGGKTGVNLPEGKNLVGAFYRPAITIIDSRLLSTLTDKIFREGLSEAVKYGVIGDAKLYKAISSNVAGIIARAPELIATIVARCVSIKLRIVKRDIFDSKGMRAVLNFGHTVGHAVEVAGGYRNLSHGEAVSIGMVAEARIAVEIGMFRRDDALHLERLLSSLGLPTVVERRLIAKALKAVLVDKKNADGALRFVLPRSIGAVRFPVIVSLRTVRKVLDHAGK